MATRTPEQMISDLKAHLEEIKASLVGVDLDAARQGFKDGTLDFDSDEPNSYILCRLFDAEEDLADMEDAHTEGWLEGFDPDELPF